MANFKQAMFQANLLYGLDLEEYEFEELGLIAWEFIGNKHTRLYRACLEIDCRDLSVELPCNADIIEAVTYTFEDPKSRHELNDTEQYIEYDKQFKDPLYTSGKFVHYNRIGNKLYFEENYGKVQVLYKGIVLDEEGLPDINEKESIAIATYAAYATAFKEFIKSGQPQAQNNYQVLKQEWAKKCDAARTPEYLNQNDMNEILDAKTSWDRKVYNKSLKPLK